MLCIVATLPVKAGKEEAFEELFRERMKYSLTNRPGTLVYQLAKSPDKPLEYTLIEIFKDEAAHHIHADDPTFKKFSAQTRDMIDGTPKVERLTGIV